MEIFKIRSVTLSRLPSYHHTNFHQNPLKTAEQKQLANLQLWIKLALFKIYATILNPLCSPCPYIIHTKFHKNQI